MNRLIKTCPKCGNQYEIKDNSNFLLYIARCKCGYDENMDYTVVKGKTILAKNTLRRRIDRKLRYLISELEWSNIIYRIKCCTLYPLQRVFRGYSNRDLWDFDCFLADIITRGAKDLKKFQAGMPLIEKGYRPLIAEEQERFNKAKGELAEKLEREYQNRWNEVLDKIACGFKVAQEAGGTEDIRAFEIQYEDKELAKQKLAEYQEGWDLFRKFFGSLWD